MLALIADAKTRICIYGSLDVVQELHDFEKLGAIATGPRGHAALAALLSAMREDVTGRGFSGREDIFLYILFGKTGAGATMRRS
jgi:hypothetical protein